MVSYNSVSFNRTTLVATAGQTEFIWTFWTPTDVVSTDIKMRVNNAIYTDYTIDLPNKTITTNSGLTAGDDVEIYRRLDTKFNAGFAATTVFSGPVIEKQMGKLLAFHQDLQHQVERFTVCWPLATGQNKTWDLLLSAYNGFTIDRIIHKTTSGSIDFTVNRNGSALSGLDGITMSSTQTTIKPTSTITINPGDKLTIVTSDNNDALGVAINFYCTKQI